MDDPLEYTLEEMEAELQKLYPPLAEKPDDWLNKDEAAAVWNCSRQTAQTRLENLVTQGLWETKNFRADNGRPAACYRMVKKK